MILPGSGSGVARFGFRLITSLLLLAGSTLAQPVTVLDRIGTNAVSTDDNPGGLISHHAHGTTNELWGTCGTVWTQSFAGTLAEVACVGFARVVNATNGMLLDPVTNLSNFTVNLHLWTNGAAAFLTGSNCAHGDLTIPLGAGPSAPGLFGVTQLTNSVGTGTNTHTYISTLPTFLYATNLAALGVRLEAGREYGRLRAAAGTRWCGKASRRSPARRMSSRALRRRAVCSRATRRMPSASRSSPRA